MIKWKGAILLALALGTLVSITAFSWRGESIWWAMGGFGIGVCLALGIAVIDGNSGGCCGCPF